MFAPENIRQLHELLRAQSLAALGTLHRAEPFVSMVPVALLPAQGRFVVHVSRLATHTKDMLDHPAVSLMLMAPDGGDGTPRERARATFQCDAEPCPPDAPLHDEARQAYLARFPDSAELFGFADFSLVLLAPRWLRHVGGFGRAGTVMQPELAAVLSACDTLAP
jgi:putative heme iron utilization protein